MRAILLAALLVLVAQERRPHGGRHRLAHGAQRQDPELVGGRRRADAPAPQLPGEGGGEVAPAGVAGVAARGDQREDRELEVGRRAQLRAAGGDACGGAAGGASGGDEPECRPGRQVGAGGAAGLGGAARAVEAPLEVAARLREPGRLCARGRDQNPDGTWPVLPGGDGDSNLTASGIAAAVAAGVPARDPRLQRAVRALGRFRSASGGYALTAGARPDAQSTAWVLQGLAAVGRRDAGAEAFRRMGVWGVADEDGADTL
ncbi:MAG: hypothetical protein ACKOSO_11240 [Actinomycetota bacterium]